MPKGIVKKCPNDAAIMYAEHEGLYYFKHEGEWQIHGSQFKGENNKLYTVSDQELYDTLEAKKTFKR